jgi:hypothetical protein
MAMKGQVTMGLSGARATGDRCEATGARDEGGARVVEGGCGAAGGGGGATGGRGRVIGAHTAVAPILGIRGPLELAIFE